MMKKLLALTLTLSMILSMTMVFAEDIGDDPVDEDPIVEEEDYFPFKDYGSVDEDGNYTPMDTYYNGRLVGLNPSINISEIKAVTLTAGDVSRKIDVQKNGYFSMMLPDSRETMTVTIPDDKYFILTDTPIDNNKIFVSLSEGSPKDVYVGIRSNITGIVTNSDETEKIVGASVTCYYRPTEKEEWSLWMNNEFSSSPNRTTDGNGMFSYAVTSGQYKFIIKKDGYTDYNSIEREYVAGVIPGNETTFTATFHLTANKFMSLVSTTPSHGGTITPNGEISIVFNKAVSKASVSERNNLRLESVSTKSYVPCTVTVNGATVTVKPTIALYEGQKFNIILTKNISAVDGATLDMDRVITIISASQSTTTPGNVVAPNDDVTGHWSEKYMKRLIDLNIIDSIQKDGKLNYYPDKPLTRGEFAKYIVMSQNIEIAKEKSGTFKDGDIIPFELRSYVY
ncbi:MAG: Ig-like domain-containing protein, partial [Eubacteriales bacterium]|nr:Ig-like domain-containing protein [Eubacteriales bacterium]